MKRALAILALFGLAGGGETHRGQAGIHHFGPDPDTVRNCRGIKFPMPYH